MTQLTHADAHRLLHAGRRWLDNKAAAALDAHLTACAECRAYAADIARLEPALTRALHARWDHVQTPAAAPAADDAPAPRPRPRRLHPALTFAAAGLVLALIIVILPVFIAPPPAATPVPAASAALPGMPSPTPQAFLDRALFAADFGEFSGPPEATRVEFPPGVIAWDPVSDRVLWTAETGLSPRISVDRQGRFVYVLSQPKADASTLSGLTYDSNEVMRPNKAWPLRVSILDPGGTPLHSIDLPENKDWMNLIGSSEDRLYLYRFAETDSLYAIELVTGSLRSIGSPYGDLCTDAYPRYVQLAPDGSAVYAFCTPNVEPARWWVQITRLDEESPPVRIDLPRVGGVGRWGNGLLLSPDGARLYVADTLQGFLGEIDTARGEMVRTAQYKPVGRQGRAEALMTLSADGRTLYLGAQADLAPDSVVWAVDTLSLEPLGAVDLSPALPSSLAVRLDKLYAATDQGIAGVKVPGGESISHSVHLPNTVSQLVPYPNQLPIAVTLQPPASTGLSLLAFESNRDGDSEIYVMRSDGSQLRNLTQRPGPDRAPAWSPDGRYLAYLAQRGDATDVMVLDVATALATTDLIPPVRVMQGSASVSLSDQFSWSPDGAYLAVSFWPQNTTSTTDNVIQLVDVNAALNGIENPAPLLNIEMASEAHFSPDGVRLLYSGLDEAGHSALFVHNLATGERLNVTAMHEGDWAYNGYAWSSNSKFVFFLRTGRVPGSAPGARAVAQLVIDGPDELSSPRILHELSPSPNGIFGLSLSPNGLTLFFVSDRENNGCWHIHLFSLETTALSRLEGACYTPRTALPSWSPDSRLLVFTAGWAGGAPAPDGNAGRALELTAVNVPQALADPANTQLIRLTHWLGDDLSPQWQP